MLNTNRAVNPSHHLAEQPLSTPCMLLQQSTQRPLRLPSFPTGEHRPGQTTLLPSFPRHPNPPPYLPTYPPFAMDLLCAFETKADKRVVELTRVNETIMRQLQALMARKDSPREAARRAGRAGGGAGTASATTAAVATGGGQESDKTTPAAAVQVDMQRLIAEVRSRSRLAVFIKGGREVDHRFCHSDLELLPLETGWGERAFFSVEYFSPRTWFVN